MEAMEKSTLGEGIPGNEKILLLETARLPDNEVIEKAKELFSETSYSLFSEFVHKGYCETSLFAEWLKQGRYTVLIQLLADYYIDEVLAHFKSLMNKTPVIHITHPDQTLKILIEPIAFKDIQVSLLFAFSRSQSVRLVMKKIVEESQGKDLVSTGLLSLFFEPQTLTGWEGESIFSILCKEEPGLCYRILKNHSKSILAIAGVADALLRPITAEPKQGDRSIFRLLESAVGIRVLQLLFTDLDQIFIGRYDEIASLLLTSAKDTHAQSYTPFDKIKAQSRPEYPLEVEFVFSSRSLLVSLVRTAPDKMIRLLREIQQREETAQTFVSKCKASSLWRLENPTILVYLLYAKQGSTILRDLFTIEPSILEASEEILKKSLYTKIDDQYVISKLVESPMGTELLQMIVLKCPAAFNETFREVLITDPSCLEALSMPSVSLGDQSEAYVLYKLLNDQHVFPDSLSQEWLQLFAKALTELRGEEKDYTLLEVLSKHPGGRAFISRAIQRFPALLVYILNQNFKFLEVISAHPETKTLLTYFTKIHPDQYQGYAEHLCQKFNTQLGGYNVLGHWIKSEEGIEVLIYLRQKVPQAFNESEDLVKALSIVQDFDGVQMTVLQYLCADPKKTQFIWDLLRNHMPLFSQHRHIFWHGLEANGHQALRDLMNHTEGVQILLYLFRYCELFWDDFGKKFLDLMTKEIDGEILIGNLVLLEHGEDMLFYLYFYHPKQMSTYATLIWDRVREVLEAAPDKVNCLFDPVREPEELGNCVWLAWVRARESEKLLASFSSTPECVNAMNETAIRRLGEETDATSSNPGETIIHYMVSDSALIDIFARMLTLLKKQYKAHIITMLQKPTCSKSPLTGFQMLQAHPKGEAICQQLSSSEGIFSRLLSIKKSSKPEEVGLSSTV